MEHINHRRESLRDGSVSADSMLVQGSREFLESLIDKGVKLYLASGTDEHFVKEEAALLDVAKYFDKHIYGAIDAVSYTHLY